MTKTYRRTDFTDTQTPPAADAPSRRTSGSAWATLVVLHSPTGQHGRRFDLVGAAAQLGQDPGCDVQLSDPYVSAYHAQITPMLDHHTSLADLGSASGTFLNGVRILNSVELHSRDTIRVGRHLLVLIVPVSTPDYDEILLNLIEVDALTGALRPRRFEERVRHAMSKPDAIAQHAILALEIDGLAKVRTTHGDVAGDRLLAAVGERLRITLEPHEPFAIQGEGTFTVLLDRRTAAHRCDTIRRHLTRTPILAEPEIAITCSFGISAEALDTDDPVHLLRSALANLALVAERCGDTDVADMD